MGEHKQNVPTRFDAETLLRIDEEKDRHGFETRSQYIRLAMKKWLSMVAKGTVQLLDAPLQAEHWKNCAPREQGEQCEQSELPAPVLIEGRPKPPVRAVRMGDSRRGRDFGGVSRRGQLEASVAYGTSFHVHFTPVRERVA